MHAHILEQLKQLTLSESLLNNLDECKSEAKPYAEVSYNIPPAKFFQPDEDGDTCLHISIAKGYFQAAEALIRCAPSVDVLNAVDNAGQTCLHLAVQVGNAPLVRLLVVAGVRSDIRDAKGESPLHLAVRKRDLECCKAIVEPLNNKEVNTLGRTCTIPCHEPVLNQWNFDGQTCVHLAAESGDLPILKQLVEHGADVNAREGRGGHTALHVALLNGREAVLHFLLESCPNVDATVANYGGKTAAELQCKLSEATAEKLARKLQS